ncbi:MAG: C40 family peptidase [Aureispira sp.]|nr:C40 family peptidase [Aureispira sp.]
MLKIEFKLLFFLGFFSFLTSSCVSTSKSSSSSKVSAEVKMRQNIINYAKKYQGIKYKYAGKDPKGFDCSGFTYYVFKNFDVSLSGSSSAQSKQGKEIPLAKAQQGDLIFFGRNGRTGKIQHVGLVYKNTDEGLFMIHSSSKRGIVIDNVTTSKYWKPKILYTRRVIP